MDLQEKFQLAYSKLKSAKRVLLVGHISPDADALASIGAIIEIIAKPGLDIYAYAEKKMADIYRYIPNENLVTGEEPADLRVFDVILVLDCGSISRTGLEARLRTLIKAEREGRISERPYLIEFDHHQPQESYADLEIRLPEKASTTEVVYNFMKASGLEITRNIANCILIGLMTDTGHFLHANSSREAIAVSSEMLLHGASFPKVIDNTINNKNFLSLKVWGAVLGNLHFNEETGLASSAVTEEELKQILSDENRSAIADLFGDIVSFMASLSGVRVAVLLREEGGQIKGSLRTVSDDIDVAKIAQTWGGGGHKKAAGFALSGRLLRTSSGWKVIK